LVKGRIPWHVEVEHGWILADGGDVNLSSVNRSCGGDADIFSLFFEFLFGLVFPDDDFGGGGVDSDLGGRLVDADFVVEDFVD
jgi:hypothetical protein